MKKLLLALLGILIALPALAAVGSTFSYEYEGQNVWYTILSETDKTVETMEGTSSAGMKKLSGALILPEKVKYGDTEYTLKRIGRYSFTANEQLESIAIPEGVTSIEIDAFKNCTSLTSINIPAGISTIKYESFYGCSSLTDINIPAGVTEIGWNAFAGCSALTSIELPEGLTTIKQSAFSNCTSLIAVELPESLTTIESSAFENCTALISVELPEGLTTIKSRAFYGCSSIFALAIPSTVNSIESYAFRVKKAVVPEGAKLGLFFDTDNVQFYDPGEAKVSEGNLVSNDGTLLFANAVPGNEYVVRANVNKVGNDALRLGTDIRLIVENASEPISFDDGAFNEASVASLYLDRVVSTAKAAFPAALPAVGFGDNVTSVAPNTFRGCTGLTTLTIPANIKTVGANAFLGCKNISHVYPLGAKASALDAYAFDDYTYGNALVTLPDDADLLSYRDGANNWPLFLNMTDSGLGGERLEYSGLTYRILGEGFVEVVKADNYVALTEVAIPERITRNEMEPDGDNDTTAVSHQYQVVGIAPDAFEGLTNITSVKLSDTVKEIGPNAFKGCTSLSSIEFGTGLERIGASAFGDCSSLTKIEVTDNSLLQIADKAFRNCSALASFIPGANLRQIGVSAFNGCVKLTAFDFESTPVLSYIGAHAFDGVKLKEVKFGRGLKHIGDYAFNSNNRLTTLSIPKDGLLKEIGAYAFASNVRISSDIILPDSLERLGTSAFNDARSIKKVALPGNGILAVGDSAFFQCQRLERVWTYSNKADAYLGAYAFSGCDKLASVDLQVDEIDEYAFNADAALKHLRLAGNGRLGSYALKDCSALTFATLSMDTISSNIAPGCTLLDSLDLYGNVKVIEINAFKQNTSLKAVKFGLDLENIAYEAFPSQGIENVVFPSAEEPNPVIVVGANNFTNPKTISLGNRMKEYKPDILGASECDLGMSVENLPGKLNPCSHMLVIPGSVKSYLKFGSYVKNAKFEYSTTNVGFNMTQNGLTLDSLILEKNVHAGSTSPKPKVKNLIFPDNSEIRIDQGIECILDNSTVDYVYVGSSVKSLTFTGKNNYIGNIVFSEGIEKLDKTYARNSHIKFPGSLKRISDFYIYSGAESMVFADGDGALEIASLSTLGDNKNLANIYVGRTITGVDNLFQDATALKRVIVGNDADSIHTPVVSIPKGMFKGCTALENAVLSDSIRTIGEEAFDGCSSLKVVSFSEDLATVGLNAYRGCTGLDRIVARGLVPARDVNDGSIFDADIEDNVPLYYPAEAEDAYFDSDAFTLFMNLLPHEDNVVKDVIVEVPEETDFDNMDEGFSSPIEQLVNTSVELVRMELLPEEAPARKAPRRAAADGTSSAYGTETPIYWFSPNPEIASIDENNVLTIHKNEPAEIWAIALDGSDVKAVVGINRYLLGDVNGDKVLNTADVNALVGHIVAPEGSTIRLKVADMNADGAINTADVNILINSILEK